MAEPGLEFTVGLADSMMVSSIIAMIACRIMFAYVLSVWCGMGMVGTWAAMVIDGPSRVRSTYGVA